MKKRNYFALILCLVVCLSVVTGCNLITRNDKAYFEAIVCTIDYADGTKDEITKRELLTAYNSYGYNYEQNYGQTRQEAIKTTLDTVVNQHLTIKAVRDHYQDNLFNGRETTYLWDSTYNSIYSNLKSYYEDVTGEHSSSSSDATDTKYGYSPYEKQVYLDEVEVTNKFPKPKIDAGGKVEKDENGKVVYETDGEGNIVYETKTEIKLILKTYQTASTIRDGNDPQYAERTVPTANGEVLNLESKTGESQEYFYQCISKLFTGKDKESNAWKSAFNKYLADVKENYTYINFKNDKECFLFEVNRVYEIVRDNYLVEKYSVIYNAQQQNDSNLATVTVGDVLDYYASKVRADYETYRNDRPGFDSQILTNVSDMDYIYSGQDETNFFYVGYVKMEFDEAQQAAYDAAQKLTGSRKDAALKKVYDGMYATKRDDKGEKSDEKVFAGDLKAAIEKELAKYSYLDKTAADAAGMSEEERQNHNAQIATRKAAAFRDFMFAYSDDEATKNAEYATVLGVNSKGEAVLPSAFSQSEDAAEKIEALYNGGNAEIGDLSALVKGSDGMYLFFFAGDVNNVFAVGDDFSVATKDENIKVLAATKLNIFSNKTYLDKLYEELKADKFTVFQNMNIQNLRANLATKIVAVENNYKDLY